MEVVGEQHFAEKEPQNSAVLTCDLNDTEKRANDCSTASTKRSANRPGRLLSRNLAPCMVTHPACQVLTDEALLNSPGNASTTADGLFEDHSGRLRS